MSEESVSKASANTAYTSGEDYDAQYSTFYEPEIRTLTALAQEQGGAVLDLCCGTGIVTLPLARTGLPVVGVDMSDAMLATAREKAGDCPNLAFVLADALEYGTATRFSLVLMTGNAFQCFLSESDLERLFAQAYALLLPGGSFIFDTRLPEGYDFTLASDYQLWSEYADAEGNPVRFLVRQAAYDPATGLLRYDMKDVLADGTETPSSETLKFTPLRTLRDLARQAGFDVVSEYGNWDQEPLPSGAASGVFELRKP